MAQFVGETLGVIGMSDLAGWVLAFIVATEITPDGTIDLRVVAGVPVLLLAVRAFASFLPARRATRIDRRAALRQE